MGLSNQFLDQAGHSISPYYETTLPCDLLLKEYKPKQKPGLEKTICFVNTAISTQSFGHFQCITFLWAKKKVILFDSLALELADPNVKLFIEKYLKMHPKFQLQLSPYPIQDEKSFFCGIYVLSWLASQNRTCNETLDSFYKHFYKRKSRLLANDERTLSYLLNRIANDPEI